jgi:hypothetical protein
MNHSVIKCVEKHPAIPLCKVEPFPFREIRVEGNNELIDVVGVVQEVGRVCLIKKQDGSEARRLEFTVVEPRTFAEMKVFFWEELIEECVPAGQPIVIKNIRINSYRESLQLISTYNTYVLPSSVLGEDHPVFVASGRAVLGLGEAVLSVAELSRQLDILQHSGKEVQSRLKARIISVNERNQLHYLSCPTCLKKVTA